MKRTAVFHVAPLYQAMLNALPPWPYEQMVQSAYCVWFRR